MSRIKVTELNKHWPGTKAVDQVSFVAEEGSLTVLLGPSGCGKSTILRLIAGLEEATSGRISIDDRDITGVDPARRGISMVFQSYALFPHLNVAENILFGLKVRKVNRLEREQRLNHAAALVGLNGLLERKPSQLSGGQRQRVALARTIVARQPVCLMDEPLSNLDAKLRAEMREEIRSLQQQLGLTMIYVTHDQTEAMTMADQVILLRNGKVEQSGTPRELYDRPATAFSAHFFGQPPMNLFTPAKLDLDRDQEILPPELFALGETGRDQWLLGIRPEDIRLADQGLAVEVVGVDYLGAETIVKFKHGEQVLAARLQGRGRLRKGEQHRLSWSRGALHVFDHKGKRREFSELIPSSVEARRGDAGPLCPSRTPVRDNH